MRGIPLPSLRLSSRLTGPLRPLSARGWPGLALFGGLLLGLPLNPYHLAQVQALNRELGKLCSSPPRQAVTVCRIHARLVDSL